MSKRAQVRTIRTAAARDADVIVERFRLFATLRSAWLRKIWSEEETAPGAITAGEIAVHLEDRDSPSAELRWQRGQEQLAPFLQRLPEMSHSEDSRFAQLVRIFGLNESETALIEACLALAFRPPLRRVAAFLQDHSGREYITEELVERLYRVGGLPLSQESALLRWELCSVRDMAPGEPRALLCDPAVASWIRGTVELREPLVGIAVPGQPAPPLPSWPIEKVRTLLARVLREGSGQRVRVIVTGRPGTGRRSFAAAICAENRLIPLVIDTERTEETQWKLIYCHAQRHAFLNGTPICWIGKSAVSRGWPSDLPAFPLQFLAAEHEKDVAPAPGLVDTVVALRPPSTSERRQLWLRAVPAAGNWPTSSLQSLIARYRVVPGEIMAVAATGADNPRDVCVALRRATRARLGDLAQLLPASFRWNDLVIPQALRESIEDLMHEAATRSAFWERPEARRLFPLGRGLVALFSGPPGTGKTMAAQVIAGHLGYDLVRADLAGLVSKYVGESSKNIRQLLRTVRDSQSVLLCDEADALFAKRSQEVHDALDRFANTDAAYLLQAVEDFPGVVLLTTNQKGNIDPAFLRRIRYDLEFPRPSAADRLQIWKNTVGVLSGDFTDGEEGLRYLASAHELTGAQIKNAVLSGVFHAHRMRQPTAVPHLLRGVERELAKEGRSLSARDRERMIKHARQASTN